MIMEFYLIFFVRASIVHFPISFITTLTGKGD